MNFVIECIILQKYGDPAGENKIKNNISMALKATYFSVLINIDIHLHSRKFRDSHSRMVRTADERLVSFPCIAPLTQQCAVLAIEDVAEIG